VSQTRVYALLQVILIATGADQVLTPQDTPGCKKSLHERMEALVTMVQVGRSLTDVRIELEGEGPCFHARFGTGCSITRPLMP
jgi:hypothetical protein